MWTSEPIDVSKHNTKFQTMQIHKFLELLFFYITYIRLESSP